MRGQPDMILVFINILCHTNQDGICDRHWRAIVDETGLPEDRVRAAIAELESPDEESRTPVDEGRRLKRLDDCRTWGWQVVNFEKYRSLHSAEGYREYMRDYMRKSREKPDVNNMLKQNIKSSVSVSASVSASSPEGGCKGGKTYKQWDEADLAASVNEANAEGILDGNQVKRFIEYWSEPMASGRPRMSAQKAWDTKRRLRTWADRNESNTPTPAPRKKEAEIRKSRDMVLRDAVYALEAADKQGGDVGRCLQALGDKFRDYGKNRDGLTVAGEAYEVFKYRKQKVKGEK